jgi:hypothetical protein
VAGRQPDLLEIAAAHVRIGEASRGKAMLWGRLGGSEAENQSARLLARQLDLPGVALRPVTYDAHRPVWWRLHAGDIELHSAFPAPFDARFPASLTAEVTSDPGAARGKWLFYESEMQGSPARTAVREKNIYRQAVAAGASGLIFSLPHAARAATPVDRAFAHLDAAYPDGRRPIPCFCVNAEDGGRLRHAGRASVEIRYDDRLRRHGRNVVAQLPGQGKLRVGIFNHLDCFFSGACDNATGIAVMAGLARRLRALPITRRHADFVFAALSSHHDGGRGMRALDLTGIQRAILLEHLDALGQDQAGRFNDRRFAYYGSQAWPEDIRSLVPRLVRETSLMTAAPSAVEGCIGDLLVICGRLPSFTLIQAPPYYHTDHDTLDKISGPGLEAAVEFHMRLFAELGWIV